MFLWHYNERKMTSGISAFNSISHNLNRSLNICQGLRPEVNENTMPEYVKLMKNH